MTALDIQAEYWAHHFAENPEGDDFEDEDFDLQEVLREMEGGEDSDWEEVDLDEQ